MPARAGSPHRGRRRGAGESGEGGSPAGGKAGSNPPRAAAARDSAQLSAGTGAARGLRSRSLASPRRAPAPTGNSPGATSGELTVPATKTAAASTAKSGSPREAIAASLRPLPGAAASRDLAGGAGPELAGARSGQARPPRAASPALDPPLQPHPPGLRPAAPRPAAGSAAPRDPAPEPVHRSLAPPPGPPTATWPRPLLACFP